jgi:hypothetical protein
MEHLLINMYYHYLLILIKDFHLYLLFYQLYYLTDYLLHFFNIYPGKYSIINVYY